MTTVSVVIRAKDEGADIGRTLDLLQDQTVVPEIVVVDSGSSDATVAIAGDHGARVIEIPAESFTFGGALNTGTEAASGEIVIALSAHAFPHDDGWIARLLDALADERVACASGQLGGPHGERLEGRIRQEASLVPDNPLWGYSNHAGAYRRALWAQYPFRTDMTACEDKEWAWHWMERGYAVVLGPDLTVAHGHSSDPPMSQYDRAHREWAWTGEFADVRPMSLGELRSRWWNEREGYPSAFRARLARKRIARLLGERRGRRAAARRRA